MRRVFLTVLAIALTSCWGSALADLPIADGGPSGQWWNPARDGEGLFVEILPIGAISISWFTYDEVGNQIWLTGLAEPGPDDTTDLGEIHQNDGVAINLFGEVAFHGKVSADTDVVIVSETPIPDESCTEWL